MARDASVTEFDQIVLGAGPAGSTVARLLALNGARVLLVERYDFEAPRPGEHLSGVVRVELDRLAIPLSPFQDIASRSAGIVSRWDGSRVERTYQMSGAQDGICVVRNRFDEALYLLAIEAGVKGRCRQKIHGLGRQRGMWSGMLGNRDGMGLSIRAPLVIDATGRRAAFARSQGAQRISAGDQFALTAWLDGDTTSPDGNNLLVEECASGWWSLSCNIAGGTIATHYTSLRTLKQSKLTPRQYWDAALAQTVEVRRIVGLPVVGHFGVYPAFPAQTSSVVGTGWLAVGDAAATLDPVGGQGLVWALHTAQRALEALLADPGMEVLGPLYRDAVGDRLQRHLTGRRDVYGSVDKMHANIAERIRGG